MNSELRSPENRKPRVGSVLFRSRLAYNTLLGLVFFTICFGLGYATLNRYDPRLSPGTRDSIKYYRIVVDEPQRARDVRVEERVLVPYLAKPIYWVAKGRVGTWDPGLFAMLVVNSFFCAVTAVVLTIVAQRLTGDNTIALLGATLYLLNFAVVNLQLSGLVDSAFACLMMIITLTMLTGRLFWLPVIMIVGALSKDTFLPLATLFVIIWLLVEYQGRLKTTLIVLIVGTITAGLITTSFVQYLIFGQTFERPWIVLFTGDTIRNVFSFNAVKSFLSGIFAKETLYVFGWLLPLGLWRLKRLPLPWVLASLATSLVILFVAGVRGAGTNASRPIFNVAGAMLSLSVAILLAGWEVTRQDAKDAR